MPTVEHRASDYLKTPEDIAAYLNAAVEEMGDDPRLLMKAFRNVAEARGGRVGDSAPGERGQGSAVPRAVGKAESPAGYAR